MSALMDMFGFLMSLTVFGGPIIMENGFGIQLLAGPGFRLIRGDGVFPITEDGTGELAWVGIGSPQSDGARHGFTGIGGMTTLAGVP